AATGRERLALPQKQSYNLAFAPDGRTLAVTGEADSKVTSLWELASGEERARIEEKPPDRDAHLCFSPDGRWLARQEERFVQLLGGHRGEKIHTFKGHENGVNGLTFSRDGRKLISCSFDTTILIWDVAAVIARQRSLPPPSDAAVKDAWNDLASADAKVAFRA